MEGLLGFNLLGFFPFCGRRGTKFVPSLEGVLERMSPLPIPPALILPFGPLLSIMFFPCT